MASGPASLDAFVRDALLRGMDRGEIRRVLVNAEWPAEQVALALDAYADVVSPVPVPRPRASVSAREAFLYLVLFTALYLSAFNLGHILFELIDRAFPDPAASRLYPSALPFDEMRWSIAALSVAFPVFLGTSTYVGRGIARNAAGRLSPVRRWCIYLTLFVGVACLIVAGTTLVYNMLGGELTIRFFLKVLVVGGIAGGTIGHYLRDLGHGEATNPTPTGRTSPAAILATSAVLAAVVAALIVMGPPSRLRQRRLDAQRVADLGRLAYAVDEYWNHRNVLPPSQDTLVSDHQLDKVPHDPETGATYPFTVTSPKTYRLCATFEQPSPEQANMLGLGYYGLRQWHHGAGTTCFDIAPRQRPQ